MKKILITLMTVLALTVFTACESKNVEIAEETTASVAEETTTETEAETTTEATTEAETTTEKETEAETEPEVVEDTEVFAGTGYTLAIDGEKWIDGTEYIELVAKLAENTEAAKDANLTADDMNDMGDAIYYHTTNGSNFNVSVAEVGDVSVIDDAMLEQLGALMQEQYNSMTGYVCDEYEFVEVNGCKAIKFVITADGPIAGTALKLNAYLIYHGTKQIAVTYTAAASNFDDTVADFEKVLNTITLTEETASADISDKTENNNSSEVAAQASSYSVDGFSFEYDSAKWKHDEDEDIFNYIASNDIWGNATNFNIKQQYMGMDIDMNDEMMELFATSVQDEYNNTDGVTFLDWSSYNGSENDVLLINCEAEYMSMKMKLQQYCFLKSGKMTILTFTVYSDYYDKMLPEFEAIVNSVELE